MYAFTVSAFQRIPSLKIALKTLKDIYGHIKLCAHLCVQLMKLISTLKQSVFYRHNIKTRMAEVEEMLQEPLFY